MTKYSHKTQTKIGISFFWAITTIIILMTCILLTIRIEKFSSDLEDCRINLIFAEHEYEVLGRKCKADYKSIGIRLNDLSLISDQGTKLLLSSLVESPKLIYRFSNKSCPPCVNDEILTLLKVAKEIGDDNIIIIPDYQEGRESSILKERYKLQSSIFTYQGEFEIPCESNSYTKNGAFFILIDKNLNIISSFQSFDDAEILDGYMKHIIDYYNSI